MLLLLHTLPCAQQSPIKSCLAIKVRGAYSLLVAFELDSRLVRIGRRLEYSADGHTLEFFTDEHVPRDTDHFVGHFRFYGYRNGHCGYRVPIDDRSAASAASNNVHSYAYTPRRPHLLFLR